MAENCSCVFSIHAIHGDRGVVRPVNASCNTGISNILVGQNNHRPVDCVLLNKRESVLNPALRPEVVVTPLVPFAYYTKGQGDFAREKNQ